MIHPLWTKISSLTTINPTPDNNWATVNDVLTVDDDCTVDDVEFTAGDDESTKDNYTMADNNKSTTGTNND